MPVLFVTSDSAAAVAADLRFPGRILRYIEALKEAVLPIPGLFGTPPAPVFVCRLNTQAMIEEALVNNCDILGIIEKPALRRSLPGAQRYEAAHLRRDLQKMLSASTAALLPEITDDGLWHFCAVLPWLLDLEAAGLRIDQAFVSSLLDEETRRTVFVSKATPRAEGVSLSDGSDYGLLCYETEKLRRAPLQGRSPSQARKAATALFEAKVRCKRGVARAYEN